MFKKVLVANRGEIAVRIIRACKELGIAAVAVYSDVDRNALHVRYADEAYLIGPAPAQESYLRGDIIIDVAKRSGAQAIHPGYGFLAENADFAQAVCDAGLVFIGPTAAAMRAMGDKMAARRSVGATGAPVVPGTLEGVANIEEARSAAASLGYPLLIKAAAGGGGKGMREVHSPDELAGAFRASAGEALASFGDDRLYIERLITEARHIEFQLLADSAGNVIHLGERECSIQRRHQKLIEESPSVALDEDLRQRMGDAAVKAARAVGYVSAGTVEFLLDRNRNFYFMEMNTRLQVEHPVSEMVTGIDIVKEQLRIADGRRLRHRQEAIRVNGWAIECRIAAEDPYNNYLPSIGQVQAVYEPSGPGVRVESGVYSGFEVSLYYDPLIAKLVVWGEGRAEAILRMRRALREYRILGIKTNIPMHLRIMDSPRFIAGQIDTKFIESGLGAPDEPEQVGEERQVAALTAALLADQKRRTAMARATVRASEERSAWQTAGAPSRLAFVGADMRYIADVDGQTYNVDVDEETGSVAVDGQAVSADLTQVTAPSLFSLIKDGHSYEIFAEPADKGLAIRIAGRRYVVHVADERSLRLERVQKNEVERRGEMVVKAPMPGLVVDVQVTAGDKVVTGQSLVILMAMKMENELRSFADGTVVSVAVQKGDKVDQGQALLVIG